MWFKTETSKNFLFKKKNYMFFFIYNLVCYLIFMWFKVEMSRIHYFFIKKIIWGSLAYLTKKKMIHWKCNWDEKNKLMIKLKLLLKIGIGLPIKNEYYKKIKEISVLLWTSSAFTMNYIIWVYSLQNSFNAQLFHQWNIWQVTLNYLLYYILN